MGKERSPKRYCEECGQLLDSKRPGVTLCRQCEDEILGETRVREKNRRKARSRARDMEEEFFLLESRD